jgi:hypothetical protein
MMILNTFGGSFVNGDLSLNVYDVFDTACDLSITEILYSPDTLPAATHVYSPKYWIIEPFGTPGMFLSDIVITFPSGYLNTTDPSLGLYRRNYNGDGAWTLYRTSSFITSLSATFSSVDTFGQFTVASNGTSTLPVSLLTFGAKASDNHVNVNWSTANEINSRHFEVERSYDMNTFEVLGLVKAGGKSTTVIKYAYTDKTADLGRTIYYRLKQVDMDGKFSYSPIAIVEPALDKESVTVYPNPFADKLELSVKAKQSGSAKIVVANIAGKIVYSSTEIVNVGKTTLSLSLDSLESGIYFITINTNGEHKTVKLVKN